MIPTAHICRCRQILFLKFFSRWAGFLATKNQTEGYLCKDKFDLLILIRQTSPIYKIDSVAQLGKKIIRLVKLATLHFFENVSPLQYTCMIQQFVSVDIQLKMFTHHLSCRNSRFFSVGFVTRAFLGNLLKLYLHKTMWQF